MNTALYRCDRKESPIDITANWVLTALLILMMTLGLTSESQAISTATIDKLLSSDGAAGDQFGISVSIAGDTAVIGANSDDDNGLNSGSAYVYVRDDNGNWSQQAKLTADDGNYSDQFGLSVSIAGDTAVIGANLDYDNGSRAGSAYVYVRDGSGNWSQQAKLTADDGAEGDQFGRSVSIARDTAVIGAFSDDDNSNNSGSTYVYVRDGSGNWSQQAKLTADDGTATDYFGFSVSIAGDTAVIGAFSDDNNGSSSGSAYVYIRDGSGNWSQQAKLIADDGTFGAQFGNSVSIAGDTAVIGAYLDNSRGSAYVFNFTNDAPPGDVTVTLTSPNTTNTYTAPASETLEWTVNGADPCQGIVLSMKRDSVPASEKIPDNLNWYRFTEHDPNIVFTSDGTDAAKCSAQVTIPGGLNAEPPHNWRFFARHVASDEFDASDQPFTYETPAITQYMLTAFKAGNGAGNLSSDPIGGDCGSGCGVFDQTDLPITLTATADQDSVFTGWSGGGCDSFGTDPCIVSDLTVDLDVTAIFSVLNDVNDGLVAFYPFNGNALDESGNGNHGTVFGSVLTEDRFGNPNNAFLFDGVDDYIEVANTNGVLDLVGAFTLSAWVKPRNEGVLSTSDPILLKTARIGVNEDNYGLFWGGSSKFVASIERESDDAGFDTLSRSLSVGSWYHVVGIYDQQNFSILKFPSFYQGSILANTNLQKY